MKKTIKHHSSSENHLPEILHMDVLAYASDEELDRHYTNIVAARDRASKSVFDFQPWEVEICYLQREMKIRSDRRKAHEIYTKNNPDLDYVQNSSSSFDA